MKKEIDILTHLFYFLPQNVTFQSKERFLNVLSQETRQNIYSAFDINKISDPIQLNDFLKAMKKHITVKEDKNGFTIVKKNSFKVLVEEKINEWSYQYKTLLTRLSKKLIVWSISYSEHIDKECVNDSQKIRIVAEIYKNVDNQVSEWLFEFAKTKEEK